MALPPWVLRATLLLIVACFLIRNLPWHLDDYDQAKQAYVSYEMVQEGAWWFQHTPTGRVATKPPLAGWISAGLALATGGRAWDLAWRLPPLVAALAMLWILLKAGRRISGELGAVLAAAAFGLNLMAPRLATLVRTDMLLALAIFLVGYLIYEKLRTGTPWTASERWQLFGLLLASMLIKGPIAYAFLLPGLAFFCWYGRRAGWGRTAWSGWWSWLGPLLIFALWAGLGILLSQEFYEEVVLKEFLGRFTVGEAARHHNQPIYFYATNLLHRFFPWSLLLIALACIGDVRAKLRRDPHLCWLACWALGGLIFMSLVPSKRGDRIFPAIPPLALLVAGFITLVPRHAYASFLTRRSVGTLLATAALFSGSYAIFEAVQGYRWKDDSLVVFGRDARAKLQDQKFALVSGKDEGMLLYLHCTRFTRLEEAVTGWKAGNLSALVLPEPLLQRFAEELRPYEVALQSAPAREKNSRYALICRPPFDIQPKTDIAK